MTDKNLLERNEKLNKEQLIQEQISEANRQLKETSEIVRSVVDESLFERLTNKEKEELRQYQEYMEMKRKKE